MALSNNYNSARRYKERARKRSTATFWSVVVVVGCFSFGIWVGKQYAAAELKSLKKQVQTSQSQLQELQDSATQMNAQAQAATLRYEQVSTQMAELYPTEGPLRDIIDLTRKQLAAGLDAERLAFVIRSARPPRNCTDPQSKRFILSTPAYKGSENKVAVGEGAVTVTGKGMSAISQAGQPEAWFDPGKPVTFTLLSAAGQSETKTGLLPLQHTTVSNGREYRFTFEEGGRSFAKVTFDSCEYP